MYAHKKSKSLIILFNQTIVVISLLLLCNLSFAQPVTKNEDRITKKQNSVNISITWGEEPFRIPVTKRVTENDKVIIKIQKGFNFVKYSLKLEVIEKNVESYKTVQNIWGQVLPIILMNDEESSLSSFSILLPNTDDKKQKNNKKIFKENDHDAEDEKKIKSLESKENTLHFEITEWSKLITKNSEQYIEDLNDFFKKPIRISNYEEIYSNTYKKRIADYICDIKKIKEMQQSIYKKIVELLNNDFLSQQKYLLFYNSEYARQKSLINDLKWLIKQLLLIQNGHSFTVSSKTGGTKIDISLKPFLNDQVEDLILISSSTNYNNETIQGYEISYISEPIRLFIVHAGLTIRSGFDYTEKITDLEGMETEITIENSSVCSSIVAFIGAVISYRDDYKPCLLLSFGTEIDSPGEMLYFGPSFAFFEDVYLTTGGIFRPKAEDYNVLENNIFKTVKNSGQTGWFVSLSIRLF